MQEVCTPIDLLLVQPAAPPKVDSCFLELGLDHCWVAPGFVQVLDIREGSAARTADEEDRLLFVEKLLWIDLKDYIFLI